MHDLYILLYGVMLNSFIGLHAIGLVCHARCHTAGHGTFMVVLMRGTGSKGRNVVKITGDVVWCPVPFILGKILMVHVTMQRVGLKETVGNAVLYVTDLQTFCGYILQYNRYNGQ